jgi:hypothetical protein
VSGLEIVRGDAPAPDEPPKGLVADRALWLDPEGRLVEEDDLSARSLLMREGGLVEWPEVQRHRLVLHEGRIMQVIDEADAGVEPVQQPPPALPPQTDDEKTDSEKRTTRRRSER